jgi:hypothetical protein
MIQVSQKTHLKLAFLLWAVVGVGLLIAGVRFLIGADASAMATGIGCLIALGLGFAKGYFVLPKIARKNSARIQQLPVESPIWATFSPKSWMLVLLMILIGRTLRALGAPLLLVGVIYLAVGLALLLGSRAYLESSPPSARG